jgi:hypothetical protein
MKKETIIAIGLGVFLGITVGVVILLNTTRPNGENKVNTPELDLQQTAAANQNESGAIRFELAGPANNSTVASNTITIKGRATKDSLLVIQSPLSNSVLKTEQDTFEVDFPLALGENVINLTFYPKGSPNSYQEKTLRVYYLKNE